MLAVLTNQPKVCRALVVAGASVDIQDQGGNSALHLACRLGYTACIQHLTSPIQPIEMKNTVSARNYRQAQSLTSQLGLKNYEGKKQVILEFLCVFTITDLCNIGVNGYLASCTCTLPCSLLIHFLCYWNFSLWQGKGWKNIEKTECLINRISVVCLINSV